MVFFVMHRTNKAEIASQTQQYVLILVFMIIIQS